MIDDKIKRIIDANCNRTREGLRVIEEIGRFLLDDKSIYAQIKTIRHSFCELEKELRSEISGITASRESSEDVGKEYIPHLEGNRQSIDSLVEANCRRVEEAMRVIEEFLKLICPRPVADIKELRFEVYTLEKMIKYALTKK
ncbi:MAG: thiamine-phosphate pyrophosphorylase [Candidatus Auribacterota bacterium]|jgi:thiamine-phosphate pyrophosphorylase|nr:thiamine-phosphate pyrophosphorylase [Candidatus Auribacterota bacterium]